MNQEINKINSPCPDCGRGESQTQASFHRYLNYPAEAENLAALLGMNNADFLAGIYRGPPNPSFLLTPAYNYHPRQKGKCKTCGEGFDILIYPLL